MQTPAKSLQAAINAAVPAQKITTWTAADELRDRLLDNRDVTITNGANEIEIISYASDVVQPIEDQVAACLAAMHAAYQAGKRSEGNEALLMALLDKQLNKVTDKHAPAFEQSEAAKWREIAQENQWGCAA